MVLIRIPVFKWAPSMRYSYDSMIARALNMAPFCL